MFVSNGKIEPTFKESQDRFNFVSCPNKSALEQLAENPAVKTLQTMENISLKTAKILDQNFFVKRPDVKLRVYGFSFDTICDLNFCNEMPHVENFSADCIRTATGIESLKGLTHLKSLGLGIYNLESFDILEIINPHLEELILTETKSKKLNLKILKRFQNLKHLYLDGHQKDIAVISTLTSLEEITLRCITTNDVSYLENLKMLRQINIFLGSIKDLSHIANCKSVKRLEMFQIRNLKDLGFISEMTGLEFILLENFKDVQKLPEMRNLSHLKNLRLIKFNALDDISAVEAIPNLKEFTHTPSKMLPQDYFPLLKNKSVEEIIVNFGNKKKAAEFETLAKQYRKNVKNFFS